MFFTHNRIVDDSKQEVINTILQVLPASMTIVDKLKNSYYSTLRNFYATMLVCTLANFTPSSFVVRILYTLAQLLFAAPPRALGSETQVLHSYKI